MNFFDRARFDGTRTVALIALSAALAAEFVWLAGQIFRDQTPLSDLIRPLIFTGAFFAIAATRGHHRWINTIGRFVIAAAFFLALRSRFSDFDGFIRYTGVVNSFMPQAIIPTLAVVATVLETICCVSMLAGFKLHFAAISSGMLLFVFATAMTISGLEQFSWAVYVLAMGGWLLATVDASILSLDALFPANRKENPWKSPVATR